MRLPWIIIFSLIAVFSFGQKEFNGVYYDNTEHKWKRIESNTIPSGVFYSDISGSWQTGEQRDTNRKAVVKVNYDKTIKRVVFDTVIEISNRTKSDLYLQCSRFFKLGSITKQKGILSSDDGMLYSDSNEIAVSGIYKTSYRPHGNSYDYNCVYTLSIKVKDGKIKCSFFDFVLYPYEIKTSSYGWFGSSGFGMGGSKTPAALNARPVEPMFLKGQTNKKFKLFPLMNVQVEKVLGDLLGFLSKPIDKDNNW